MITDLEPSTIDQRPDRNSRIPKVICNKIQQSIKGFSEIRRLRNVNTGKLGRSLKKRREGKKLRYLQGKQKERRKEEEEERAQSSRAEGANTETASSNQSAPNSAPNCLLAHAHAPLIFLKLNILFFFFFIYIFNFQNFKYRIKFELD